MIAPTRLDRASAAARGARAPLAAALMAMWAAWAAAGCIGAPAHEDRAEHSAHPGINDPYLAGDVDVDEWLERFEREGRTVYDARHDIVADLRLAPGDRVADVGTGTGLFVPLLARAVGDEGRVVAVDIVPEFLEHVRARAAALELDNVDTVQCTERSVELDHASVDLAFVCDVYHHFEYPQSTLASLHRAIAPGGALVVLDFEREPGESSEWVLGHVRAGRDQVVGEIEAAGFRLTEQRDLGEDTFFLRFARP